jgi:hypothetical protein
MRSQLLALAALGLVLGGCSKEPKEAKVWKCSELGVPGGETLSCTQQALTADGTASLNSDGYVPPAPTGGLDEEGCEGSLDTEACQSAATGGAGSATDSTSTSTDSTSSLGGATGGSGSIYFCVAGTEGCPPVSAVVGLNSDAAAAAAGSTGGTGSETSGTGTGGGATGTGSQVGSDSTSSTGDGTGGGGGDGDEEGGGKSGKGGGAGSTPGGTTVGSDGTSSKGSKSASGAAESYRCEKKKNGRVACTRTEPKCEEGLSAAGGVCSAGGTSDSTSSTGSPTGSGGSTSSSSSTTGGDGSVTTTIDSAPTPTTNGKTIDLTTVTTNPDGTKTWTYEVCEVSGHDLSNWVLGTGSCQIVSASPNQGFEKTSNDPNGGLTGVKWNTGEINGCVTYSVTTVGGTQTLIPVSAKASTNVSVGYVPGPQCN